MALPTKLRRLASLAAIAAVVNFVYANRFSRFQVLERRHSVRGDADAAAFVPLVPDNSVQVLRFRAALAALVS